MFKNIFIKEHKDTVGNTNQVKLERILDMAQQIIDEATTYEQHPIYDLIRILTLKRQSEKTIDMKKYTLMETITDTIATIKLWLKQQTLSLAVSLKLED